MVTELGDGARAPEFCTQGGFAYRFDWGVDGLEALAHDAAVVVVIDVLRFTTAVCCALEAGATVLPYRWRDDSTAAYAARHRAVLAGRRELGEPSLSPTDLLTLVGSIAVSLFLKNYYQATTIFYPASPQLASPELIFGNPATRADWTISARGERNDATR